MDKKEVREVLEAAMAQGGQFAELYLEYKENTGISCENGRIEKVNTGIESGVGIRVIHGDNTAYVYTNDLSQENLCRWLRQHLQQPKVTSGSQWQLL